MEGSFFTRIREYARASPREFAIIASLVAVVLSASWFVYSRTSREVPAIAHHRAAESPERTLVVHVAGLVNSPGVYDLPEGSRVRDAISAAGGPTETADLDSLNLAALLADGEKVLVVSKAQAGESNGTTGTGKVSLNSASQAQLESLPGVGPVLAQRIIAFREKRRFTTVRQLLEVEGLGQKKYESLKDLVST